MLTRDAHKKKNKSELMRRARAVTRKKWQTNQTTTHCPVILNTHVGRRQRTRNGCNDDTRVHTADHRTPNGRLIMSNPHAYADGGQLGTRTRMQRNDNAQNITAGRQSHAREYSVHNTPATVEISQ